MKHDNQFNSLAKGAQAEDWCIGLDVQCNDFMPDLSIAWLVDPEFEPGLWQGFKEQGSSAAQIPQRNQFLNKPINPRFVAHIYSNLEFVYNYDPNNPTENPESSSTIVDRFPINNPGIINYCFEVPPNPCPYPCEELALLINPNEPEASRLAQYWLRSIVDTGYVEELMYAINSSNFNNKEKYLLPLHISLQQSDEANVILNQLPLVNSVDSSFALTFSYLEQAYHRSNSLDSPNTFVYSALNNFKTGDQFYSNLAKNILEHFSENFMHPVPEFWINNPIRPQIDSGVQDLVARVYPNPLDGGILSISIQNMDSKNLNPIVDKIDIEISNALGQRIQTMNVILEKNKSTILFDVPPGLYFVRLYSDDQVILNQKIIKR